MRRFFIDTEYFDANEAIVEGIGLSKCQKLHFDNPITLVPDKLSLPLLYSENAPSYTPTNFNANKSPVKNLYGPLLLFFCDMPWSRNKGYPESRLGEDIVRV